MDFDVRNRELRFSIFGLDDPRHPEGFISADIFARKVREILAALKEADKSVNARPEHQYVVSDLKIGSAEVGLLERPINLDGTPQSSVAAFANCGEAIHRGDFSSASRYNTGVAEALKRISKSAGDSFSHIDFRVDQIPVIRVDDFFERQAISFVERTQEALKDVTKRFTGSSVDSFDGYLKEVDFRGQQCCKPSHPNPTLV